MPATRRASSRTSLGGVGLLVVAIGVLGGELLDAIDVGPDWLSPLTVGAALSAFGLGGAIAASLTDGNATAGLVYGGATAVAGDGQESANSGR
jgi:hypothetical protein